MAATTTDAFQPMLQICEQALGLLTFTGDLLLIAAQISPLGLQCGVDPLIDRALTLAQAQVLIALGLVISQ